ncbi:MAG: hypothetical protein M3409_04765, partial [Gemmatimonadota bacterium]|nr:hypothetical protein [Gemmatimonadota bacterium]
MAEWTGVVVALAASERTPLNSRLSVYLHPVAGRPLCWHALHALASVRPAPRSLVLLTTTDLAPEMFRDIHPEPLVVSPGDPRLPELFAGVASRVVVADGAAPGLTEDVQPLLAGDNPSVLMGGPRAVAALLPLAEARRVVGEAGSGHPWSDALGAGLPEVEVHGLPLVEDRAGLSRATARVRDRVVGALMEGGVTVLLPRTILVDMDVRVGRDSVIYPGVVLEGQTTIGEETVIGPGTRIVDSWVGSGVEMKGWNYISHTSIRNRAILEPYARRG